MQVEARCVICHESRESLEERGEELLPYSDEGLICSGACFPPERPLGLRRADGAVLGPVFAQGGLTW